MIDRLEGLYSDVIAAWNATDWDVMERHYAPDAVAIAPEGWPESGDSLGWPAIRKQFERLKDSWETEQLEVIGVETFENRVVGRFRWSGTSRSGIPFEFAGSQLVEYRDDLIVRVEFFLDPDAASRVAKGG